MKKLYSIIFLCFGFCMTLFSADSISIDGKNYYMEMLNHKHSVGPGSTLYGYRLPDIPLEVFIMEIEANNPYIKFEACLSKDSILELETLRSMASRKSYSNHEVIGAINGDFYAMTGIGAGTTSNGSMCDGYIGKIPGDFGPVLGFDINNIPFIDDMRLNGKVIHQEVEYTINNVNSARNENNLILYNYLNGKSTKTNQYGTEVVLKLKEGNVLAANTNINCVVTAINDNVGNTPLEKDILVLSGHGSSAEILKNISIGEELTLFLGINLLNYSQLFPQITNMIGSNCTVLKDGEAVTITTGAGSPNSVNPRTAAGYSADKSKIYFCVVDGRTTLSAGALTRQLADIMKQAGASDAMNFDGGGSTMLWAKGDARNNPTENRSIANAFLAVSTAPDDNEIAEIEICAKEIDISYGDKFELYTSTLNKYRNVIHYKNAPEITYNVVGDIGTINEENIFIASGSASSGYIEAEYKGLKDRLSVNLHPSKRVKLNISSFTIDHMREYQFIPYGINSFNRDYLFDKDLLEFKTSNEEIGIINSEGVFQGLKDGIVEIEVMTKDGSLRDVCVVTVQAGKGNIILDNFSDIKSWTVQKDFVDEVKLSYGIPEGYSKEMLKVDYVMVYENRTAFIELSKDITIYGIPDSVEVDMISNGKKTSLALFLDHTNGAFYHSVFEDEIFESYGIEIPYEKFEIQDFPLNFQGLRIVIEKDNNTYTKFETYEGTFYLDCIRIKYPDKTTGIRKNISESSYLFKIYPNPTKGYLFVEDPEDQVFELVIYDLSGRKVCEQQGNSIDIGHLPQGTYLCKIITKDNSKHLQKIILTP